MKKKGIQHSELEIQAFEHRWQQANPDGEGTLGDAMIQTIKTSCDPGNPRRPLQLDLRGINLNHQDLSGLDLSGYDFSFAHMNRVNLSGANLGHSLFLYAGLEKAVLDECEFLGADLRWARLNECQGKHCGFGGSDLAYTSLINAKFTNAVFSHSNLYKADLRAVDLTGARLTEADLSKTVLTRACLCESDLKNSNVYKTRFDLADLRRCRLTGIKNFKTSGWVGADIRDMDLRGAYLVRRHISDENYLYEFKTQSRFHNYIYWLWWLTSDCGRSLTRWFIFLFVTTIGFAILYTIVDIDYGRHETWFSSVYFSFVTLTTLGYGDITPSSVTAQIIATTQAVTGYMSLGGLLSILGNKMARRAE